MDVLGGSVIQATPCDYALALHNAAMTVTSDLTVPPATPANSTTAPPPRPRRRPPPGRPQSRQARAQDCR